MDAFELIQNGKIRRCFRSRNKFVQAGLVSHITQRAAGMDILFIDDEDYSAMLTLMKELSMKHEIKIYAFCLMPNHMHFLLCPGQSNLHVFFRDLCGFYAKWFNKRYERKGHLFGGSFRQSVVLDEGYLLTASLYIHLNPVRAGLIGNPRQYRFSSCRLYTTKDAPQSFIDPAFVLSLIANNQEKRISIYNELLDRGKDVESGNFPLFYQDRRKRPTNLPFPLPSKLSKKK
jgi:putative transposase